MWLATAVMTVLHAVQNTTTKWRWMRGIMRGPLPRGYA